MTLATSLFRSQQPIEHSVTLPDGNAHTLYFRQLPRARFLAYWRAIEKADEDTVDAETAKLIADSLCEPDGSPAIDAERASTLTIGAAQAIQAAILVVNRMSKDAQDEAKNGFASEGNIGSGMSSRSH